jgi:DNA polymerase kappa
MAGFVAKKLCPQLIQIPLNFDKYTAKAQEVREIIVDYDPRFESASIDEAYLNITEYCQNNDIDPEDAVQQLRREVHEKTKITISAGIAANAKLAKICSNKNKPNGQYRLPNDRNSILAFMRDLPTRKVNGIGRVFERELDAIGIKTCGDIFGYRHYLPNLFGEKAFVFLMQCYLGLGRTKIQPAEEYERKSVGTESTFGELKDPNDLRTKLRWTAEELEKDMLRTQFKGRTLCLKVKLHTFEVFTRQVVPPKAIYLAEDLYKYSLPMLAKLEQEFPGLKLRLMGLRCTHLTSMKKLDTMTFFGFKKKVLRDEDDSAELEMANGKRKTDVLENSQWETWPDELLFEDAERQEREDDYQEIETLSQEIAKRRRHGKEIIPNPKKETIPGEEWWDCPICLRPQNPNEKGFNEHIDLCLSRQTIRDVVQESATDPAVGIARDHTPASKRSRNDRGKDRNVRASDPKQRRLCFG